MVETELPPTSTQPLTRQATSDEFFQSCRSGSWPLVELALGQSVDIATSRDKDGCTALHWLAYFNNVPLAVQLLRLVPSDKRQEFVNCRGGDQQAAALHWAVRFGHLQMATFLVSHNADLRLMDCQRFNCLHLVAHEGHYLLGAYLVALLLKQSETVPESDIRALLNQRDIYGQMPAHKCAMNKNYSSPRLLKLFHAAEANIALKDRYGLTPLHWACFQGSDEVIGCLVRLGADLNVRTGFEPGNSLESPCEGSENLPQNMTSRELIIQSRGNSASIWFDQMLSNEGRVAQAYSKWTIGSVLLKWKSTLAYSMPFAFIGIFLLLLNYLAWYYATLIFIGVVYVCIFASIRFLFSNAPVDFCNSSFTTGIVQSSYVYVLLNWLFRVVPVVPLLYWLYTIGIVLSIISVYALKKTVLGDPGYIDLPSNILESGPVLISLADQGHLDDRHFCHTCNIVKPIRSKHCSTCQRCVAKYDHHCPFTYNCIGDKNHRYFIMFLMTLLTGGVIIIITSIYALDAKIRRYKSPIIPKEHSCILGSPVCEYFQIDTTTTLLMFWTFIQVFWVLVLFLVQSVYISMALLTNEWANYWRYDYFQEDHGKFRNPFDRGIIANCVSFWWPTRGAWRHVDWTKHAEIPQPTSILGNDYASISEVLV